MARGICGVARLGFCGVARLGFAVARLGFCGVARLGFCGVVRLGFCGVAGWVLRYCGVIAVARLAGWVLRRPGGVLGQTRICAFSRKTKRPTGPSLRRLLGARTTANTHTGGCVYRGPPTTRRLQQPPPSSTPNCGDHPCEWCAAEIGLSNRATVSDSRPHHRAANHPPNRRSFIRCTGAFSVTSVPVWHSSRVACGCALAVVRARL